MHLRLPNEKRLCQLEDVLQLRVVQVDPEKCSVVFSDAKHLLDNSDHFCVVVATSNNSSKLRNLRDLFRCMSQLKRLQRKLSKEYPFLDTSLIGIYPSLEYPACVYELNTKAARYVTENVLPHSDKLLVMIIKYLASKLLRANPTIGGLGLTVYKE